MSSSSEEIQILREPLPASKTYIMPTFFALVYT